MSASHQALCQASTARLVPPSAARASRNSGPAAAAVPRSRPGHSDSTQSATCPNQAPEATSHPCAVADARWEFVALVPLFDPPRHDTGETVRRCLEKGIMVKMITGDHLDIGQETARQLGMGFHMHTSHQLTQVRDDLSSAEP